MEKVFELNIGDEVWVMHDNFPAQGTIKKIWYTKFISNVDFESIVESEFYTVYNQDRKIGQYALNEIFRSKEDLIKSL